MLLLSVFVPVLWGLFLLLGPKYQNRKTLLTLTGLGLAASAVLGLAAIFLEEAVYPLLSLGSRLDLAFQIDDTGRLFGTVVTLVWLLAGFYSFSYMKHEGEEQRYFGFYLLVFGILYALVFSKNMVTYYLFYELMTLLSFPLILHNRSKEAIMGGLKYLFYSLFGAYLVLFGLFFLNQYALSLDFLPGGSLDLAAVAGNETMALIAAGCLILGFGVKAGLFPLHAWLPTAHPVAPAPASAVMSGIIVKMGVLGIFRGVYFLVGQDFLRGTWVQTAWMSLSLITIFLGSMLAYREQLLKKRLAYSTVSQVAYILFGLSLLQTQAATGALLHVVFHAVIKACLFLCAGAIIFQTGKTQVADLRGLGKQMPKTFWCYTIASAALIGIPPASGFISKWYLALGSLNSGIPVFSWLGPTVLLVSALLTAGYLLPITVNGFLPGKDAALSKENLEPSAIMRLPIVLLALLSLVLGLFPNPLTGFISQILG